MPSGQSGDDPPAAADNTDGLPSWATADMGPLEREEQTASAVREVDLPRY